MKSNHSPLLIATSNEGKIIEIRSSLVDLGLQFLTLDELDKINESPCENGNSFAENAMLKARFYYNRCHLPTLADDSGIIVEALAEQLESTPGVRGAGSAASDDEWISYFLKIMSQIANKNAYFTCALAYINGSGQEFLFEGKCPGIITDSLEADYLPGLPISACFRPVGFNQVFSALPINIKNQVSHRGKAIQNLRQFFITSNASP